MWDAIIAGAGPAGAVAAHVLARNGCRVLLADASDVGKHKVGEALPGVALRLLRSLALPIPSCEGPHREIGGNLSSWNSEELVPTDFIHDPDGPGWRLDRLCFDATLRESAILSGATFKNASVVDVARRGELWQVKLQDGGIPAARWLIDATGRRAAIVRRLGAKRNRDIPLVALYALGKPKARLCLNRTVVEAVPGGWWYAAFLPSGAPIAGLHVRPQDAVRLSAIPGGWHQALLETRHIFPMFSNAVFDRPLGPLDASGARLNRFVGEEWIACGDAALSFDPLSSQGIFSALHSGMTAGLAVAGALNGDLTLIDSYAARLEEVRRIYVVHLQRIYRSESRWPTESFWSSFSLVVEKGAAG
jgi:flavin-dependent dehydrogenase